MSQTHLSPIVPRLNTNLATGEKVLPDSIPEENATATKGTEDATPAEKSGRLLWLKLDITRTEWDILIGSTCLKLQLFPA